MSTTATPHSLPARVSFRRPASRDGFVDAAWWPRSRDLIQELPPLIEQLWDDGHEIRRVAFNQDWWQPAPRRVTVNGRVVRLGSFRMQDPLMISLLDAWGRERIDLLVIPPETDPDVAESAMQQASVPGGLSRPAEMMQQASEHRAKPAPGAAIHSTPTAEAGNR